jgi:serine-type D-Ala-D-Ala carboxypeptidase/endopeptidase (penicillin-binding protein 4)
MTSVTAFEILKKDFRYENKLQTIGEIKDSLLNGGLIIEGNGDSSLGSSRFSNTKRYQILNAFVAASHKKGFKQIVKPLFFNYKSYFYQSIPDG